MANQGKQGGQPWWKVSDQLKSIGYSVFNHTEFVNPAWLDWLWRKFRQQAVVDPRQIEGLGDFITTLNLGGGGDVGVGDVGDVLTTLDVPGVGLIAGWALPSGGVAPGPINTFLRTVDVGGTPTVGWGFVYVQDLQPGDEGQIVQVSSGVAEWVDMLTALGVGTLGQVLTTVDDGGLKAEWADAGAGGVSALAGNYSVPVYNDGSTWGLVPDWDVEFGLVGIDVWSFTDLLPVDADWTISIDGSVVASKSTPTPFTAASSKALVIAVTDSGGLPGGADPVGVLGLDWKAVTSL